MDVRIDMTRCEGHGICALIAPETIDLDDWGYGTVTDASPGDRRSVRRARRAAAACPRGAIVVVEDVPATVAPAVPPYPGAPGSGGRSAAPWAP